MENTIRAKQTAEIINFYGDLYTEEFLNGLNDRNFRLIYAKYEDAMAMKLWAEL